MGDWYKMRNLQAVIGFVNQMAINNGYNHNCYASLPIWFCTTANNVQWAGEDLLHVNLSVEGCGFCQVVVTRNIVGSNYTLLIIEELQKS